MSNNTIRVFNGSTLKHVWRVGALPSHDSTLPTLGSIGETAVDFDIGQPYIQESSSDNVSLSTTIESDKMRIFKEPVNRVIWPIVILRGNGNLYILITGLDSDKPQLQGPITIYPSSYDNYGVEYCSLLLLPSLPLTVIMAENSGRLHHGILIETTSDHCYSDIVEEDNNSVANVNSSFKIHRSNWVLDICEIIELEMGFLNKTSADAKDKRAECPIHLKRNILNEYQYFAYHDYGLHAVTVVFGKELENYVESENENCEKFMTFNAPSYCEYLVSTKALPTNQMNPVFGLTFTQSPTGLILLLSSGQIVTLDLILDISWVKNLDKIDSALTSEQSSDVANLNDSQLKKIIQDSFQTRIMNLLKSGNQQLPILKLNHTVEPTQEELYKFLIDTTQILTEQVFPKHMTIKMEFNKRLAILERLKEVQIQDINNLRQEVEDIRNNAECLAEKYEEVNDKQTELFKQAMNLVRLSSSKLPILSTNEKDFCNEIKLINQQTQELVNKVLLVKAKIANKDNQIDNWNTSTKSKQIILPQKPEQHVRDVLSKIVFNGSTLKHVWRVGALPSHDSTLPTLGSIGETAVDFDIGQPYIQESSSDNVSLSTTIESDKMRIFKEPVNRVIWPIVILRGNGNLYILITGLDSDKPQLQGPITIYPSSYDNYGVEYCSLLLLPSLPLTVIMAENSGRLHHGILIETTSDHCYSDIVEEDNNSVANVNSSFKIHRSNWVLDICEIIELEMGFLNKTSADAKDKRAECPIHLKRNILNEYQYFAYHDYGLHAVTVVFGKELENYVESENENCEKFMTFNAPSYCEYLVSTKALPTNQMNPVFGLTFTQSPTGLILLLSSGQIVTLDLILDISWVKNLDKIDSALTSEQSSDVANLNDSQLKKIIQDSFQTRIMNLLKSGNQQLPILKLNHTVEPTQEELYKFLIDTTQILTEQVFPKHMTIKMEFNKRLAILERLKEVQIQDINNLRQEVEDIRNNAECLAEKYEEVNDKQTELFKQAMNLVRLSSSKLPILSTNEKDFCNEIKLINQQTQELVNKVLLVKAKIANKDNQIDNWNTSTKSKQIILPQKPEQHVRDVLSKMSLEINEQLKEVKKIKEILNIS